MKVLMMNRKLHSILSFGNHAVRVMYADGILCAVCGGLYGIVFGGFGAQARNELTVSGVFLIGGIGAMIGFAIGAAVGVFNEVLIARNRHRINQEKAMRTVALPRERRSPCGSEAMAGVL